MDKIYQILNELIIINMSKYFKMWNGQRKKVKKLKNIWIWLKKHDVYSIEQHQKLFLICKFKTWNG